MELNKQLLFLGIVEDSYVGQQSFKMSWVRDEYELNSNKCRFFFFFLILFVMEGFFEFTSVYRNKNYIHFFSFTNRYSSLGAKCYKKIIGPHQSSYKNSLWYIWDCFGSNFDLCSIDISKCCWEYSFTSLFIVLCTFLWIYKRLFCQTDRYFMERGSANQ